MNAHFEKLRKRLDMPKCNVADERAGLEVENAGVSSEVGTGREDGEGAIIQPENAPQHGLGDLAELFRNEAEALQQPLIVVVGGDGVVG